MTKPDLMAELAEVVRLLDDMQSWIGPRRPDARDAEEREQWDQIERAKTTIRTHHAELEAVVRERDALRSLAAAMYQAAGTYDMPVRFLDVLATAGNGEAITEEQVDALLPCEVPAVDALPTSAWEALLPGTYYMDPPDGGDAPVYEQMRRMAKDAARYRKLREWHDATPGEKLATVTVWADEPWEPEKAAHLDHFIDLHNKSREG